MRTSHSNIVTTIAVVLLAMTLIPRHCGWSQTGPVVAAIREHSTVSRLDPVSQRERTIFRVDALRSALVEISVHPGGALLAVLETSRPRSTGAPNDVPHNRLVVMDTSGAIIESVQRNVQRFVWCCNGERVVYIAGAHREGEPGFCPASLLLYDLC